MAARQLELPSQRHLLSLKHRRPLLDGQQFAQPLLGLLQLLLHAAELYRLGLELRRQLLRAAPHLQPLALAARQQRRGLGTLRLRLLELLP